MNYHYLVGLRQLLLEELREVALQANTSGDWSEVQALVEDLQEPHQCPYLRRAHDQLEFLEAPPALIQPLKLALAPRATLLELLSDAPQSAGVSDDFPGDPRFLCLTHMARVSSHGVGADQHHGVYWFADPDHRLPVHWSQVSDERTREELRALYEDYDDPHQGRVLDTVLNDAYRFLHGWHPAPDFDGVSLSGQTFDPESEEVADNWIPSHVTREVLEFLRAVRWSQPPSEAEFAILCAQYPDADWEFDEYIDTAYQTLGELIAFYKTCRQGRGPVGVWVTSL